MNRGRGLVRQAVTHITVGADCQGSEPRRNGGGEGGGHRFTLWRLSGAAALCVVFGGHGGHDR